MTRGESIGNVTGMGSLGLTPKEARVVPLAKEFDRLMDTDAPVVEWDAHVLACFQAGCPDIGRRALREMEKKGLR